MEKSMISRTFVERLEEASAKFPSRVALAKAANMPPSSLQAYFEGAEPTRPALVALAQAADVSLDWLAAGRGHKEPHPSVPDGYGAIPYYDLLKSGGYVYPLVTQEIADLCYLKLAWLDHQSIDPGKLLMVLAMESLVPGIQLGDLLVVDSSWRTRFNDPTPVIPPGIYLVSLQARLSVREVLGVSGNFVELVQPGSRKKKTRLRVGDEGFTIHGRVIWYGRSLPGQGK
jgi:phage repressor protein C with HTH and peptisase S24 domain